MVESGKHSAFVPPGTLVALVAVLMEGGTDTLKGVKADRPCYKPEMGAEQPIEGGRHWLLSRRVLAGLRAGEPLPLR